MYFPPRRLRGPPALCGLVYHCWVNAQQLAATPLTDRHRLATGLKSARAIRPRAIILNAAIYCLFITLVCVFWNQPYLLLAAGLTISYALLRAGRDRLDVAIYLSGFCFGPLADWICVRAGAWTYSGSPRSLPLWLPFAWGIAVLLITRTARAFVIATER
jgi:hypothetical protein